MQAIPTTAYRLSEADLAPRKKLEAWMSMLVRILDRNSGVFCEVDIVAADDESVTIEWEYCFQCTGYERGHIHPRCIFCAYDFENPKSKELVFNIDAPEGSGYSMTFKGKVVRNSWEGTREHIQVHYTKISDRDRESIKDYFKE